MIYESISKLKASMWFLDTVKLMTDVNRFAIVTGKEINESRWTFDISSLKDLESHG